MALPKLYGLTTNLEIITSLVAAVTRRLMQSRHPGQYLGSERVTILVSAKQPRNIYAVTRVLACGSHEAFVLYYARYEIYQRSVKFTVATFVLAQKCWP
jgi:hypothetical protein